MADKTVGTLVQAILDSTQQNTGDANSRHAHLARRAAIDVIKRLQKHIFHFSYKNGAFQSTAGTTTYDLSAKLSANVRRATNVWYSDAGLTGTAEAVFDEDGGLPQVDANEVFEALRSETNNHGHAEMWAWYQRSLVVYPRPDGVIHFHVRYVENPREYDYAYSGGAWVYSTKVANSESTFTSPSKFDDVEDTTGWLAHAFALVHAEAVRDLYIGPYQAQDPKGVLSESWIAKRNEEWDSLTMERVLSQPPSRVSPYLVPGD